MAMMPPVEVLDDPPAGDLLERRQHRGGERPHDPAAVEAEDAERSRSHGNTFDRVSLAPLTRSEIL